MGLARSRAGFSILEAIIALAITGFAMTVVLSIGTRGSQMGFGLGNRILSATDDQMRDLTPAVGRLVDDRAEQPAPLPPTE